jgi:hypothetical protein
MDRFLVGFSIFQIQITTHTLAVFTEVYCDSLQCFQNNTVFFPDTLKSNIHKHISNSSTTIFK